MTRHLKLLFAGILAAMSCLISCTDISEIEDRLSAMEDMTAQIEEDVAKNNANISALKKLLADQTFIINVLVRDQGIWPNDLHMAN